MLNLATPLAQLKNVPPRFLKKLENLGLKTIRDLLWHFPTRYEDFSQTYLIGDLQPNQQATIRGLVRDIDVKRTWKRKMFIAEAEIEDASGTIRAVWFNQPYVKNVLKPGTLANFAGKVSVTDGELYLSNPAYEIVSKFKETRHTGRLVPVYPETRGLTSRGLRFLVKEMLIAAPSAPEILPDEVLAEFNFPEVNEALRAIHFPEKLEDAEAAKKRFAFEDLFVLQLFNLEQKAKLAECAAPPLACTPEELGVTLKLMPFPLTGAQERCLAEILEDLAKPNPMNRLLQGDVGSGKTVVAAIAALVAAHNGYQTAFMAPTEVLARQHYETLKKLFSPLEQRVNLGYLAAGGAKLFLKDDLEAELKKPGFKKAVQAGRTNIVIGTHALIQKNVAFKNLGLVIVDEQHRFGVRARAALLRSRREDNVIPHFLSMSATPIPRTLTLALFGDLELSIVDEMPKGRRLIITKVVAPENRAKAYAFIRGEIKKGRQIFVICPRINPAEESQSGKPVMDMRELLWRDVKTVKEEHERLSKKIFPDMRVAMLHGKMPSKEKVRVMSAFQGREYDILVSTSVIEVGVDIQNATVMVIEGADRFGLAQLYQLRGRVGRGTHQSYCLLFSDSGTKTSAERLAAIVAAKNGFELAEKDLALRGPGEFMGTSQTGMPDIAMRALKNINLLKDARRAAERIIGNNPGTLKKYPALLSRINSLRKEIHLE